MTLNVTYCSKDKKEKNRKIPAIQRYRSDRIQKILRLSRERGESFAILFGKYGLLKPGDEIPYYVNFWKRVMLKNWFRVSENFSGPKKSPRSFTTPEKSRARRNHTSG